MRYKLMNTEERQNIFKIEGIFREYKKHHPKVEDSYHEMCTHWIKVLEITEKGRIIIAMWNGGPLDNLGRFPNYEERTFTSTEEYAKGITSIGGLYEPKDNELEAFIDGYIEGTKFKELVEEKAV